MSRPPLEPLPDRRPLGWWVGLAGLIALSIVGGYTLAALVEWAAR